MCAQHIVFYALCVPCITDAFFGRGASCSVPQGLLQPNDGSLVGDITSSEASDADETPIGIAVIGIAPTLLGVWQYLRRDLNSENFGSPVPDASSPHSDIRLSTATTSQLLASSRLMNVTRTDVWYTFPPSLSVRSAFLLHPRDRIRFSPKPDSYWTSQTVGAPTIQLKFWDTQLGGSPGKDLAI